MEAEQLLIKIKETANRFKSDAPKRISDAASAGDAFRQGDVLVCCLKELPPDCSLVKNPDAQIAPGTTQGSRHVLSSLEHVVIYLRNKANALQGPILDVEEETTLTHPQHGNVIMGTGVYEIRYQRQMADELRRVAD